MTETAGWTDSAEVQGTNEFFEAKNLNAYYGESCLLYTSPSPRDRG